LFQFDFQYLFSLFDNTMVSVTELIHTERRSALVLHACWRGRRFDSRIWNTSYWYV